ncbi:hypothetical protein, partial [Paracraurococcus ruber]
SFTLQASSSAAPTLSTAGTLLDDDIAPVSAGRAFGTYTTAPGVNNATLSALSIDSPTATSTAALTMREGMTTAGAGIDFRWQFTNLAAGDKLLQVDATSSVEAFRLEYSTDNAATWQAFAGAPGSALAWKGDFLATGVGASLWVRLIDAVVAGDATRDTIVVDLLTLSNAASTAAIAKTEAWFLG